MPSGGALYNEMEWHVDVPIWAMQRMKSNCHESSSGTNFTITLLNKTFIIKFSKSSQA
jgi:hypothetical protein